MTAPFAPSRSTSELMWSITGTYNDILAYNKFSVFAVVSSFVVADAASGFHKALDEERAQTMNQRRRERMFRKVEREKQHYEEKRLRKRIARICEILEATWSRDWSSRNATVNNISRSRPPFLPPHYQGEPRPQGARRVRLESRFPNAGYLTYLVSKLGYNGNAAFAAVVQAHQPWLRVVDRRHATSIANVDEPTAQKYSSFVSAVHPYCPAAPFRSTRVGGGLTRGQVQKALAKKRWGSEIKEAIFEIVYRRRSTLEISKESAVPAKILYVYASRLRQDLRELKNVA